LLSHKTAALPLIAQMQGFKLKNRDPQPDQNPTARYGT